MLEDLKPDCSISSAHKHSGPAAAWGSLTCSNCKEIAWDDLMCAEYAAKYIESANTLLGKAIEFKLKPEQLDTLMECAKCGTALTVADYTFKVL